MIDLKLFSTFFYFCHACLQLARHSHHKGTLCMCVSFCTCVCTCVHQSGFVHTITFIFMNGFQNNLARVFSSALLQTTNLRLFKLEEFAEDHFKFDENCRKFSKCVENNAGKGDYVLHITNNFSFSHSVFK